MIAARTFAVVEAQLSTSGILPVRIAASLGYRAAFLTNDVARYADLENFTAVFGAGVEVVEADTNSVDGVLAGLGQLEELAAVYTHCDYNLPLVAAAARELRLPGLSPEAAAIARNKLSTRRACQAAGVPVPGFVHATTEAEAVSAADRIGFPCVVKPMTESASTGVALAYDREDLTRYFRDIAGQPFDARGQQRLAGALIEEYALGYEVSVETVTHAGTTTLLGVTDKLLSSHPYFAEIGDTFPSVLPDNVTARLAQVALNGLAAIGHDFGAAHTEVKMTPDGPKLIEINARIGGAEIADLVEASMGFPYREQIVRMHTGQSPNLMPTKRGGAASRYVMARERGVVRSVHGAELAARIPGVTAVEVKAYPGKPVTPPRSNHELYGHVVAVGDSAAEAGRRADAALAQISLRVETTPS
jgi:biotin carboxylase